MPAAQLSAAQLHEPILPLARPLQVVLSPDQTIDQTPRAIRARGQLLFYFGIGSRFPG